jgi:phospholipase C
VNSSKTSADALTGHGACGTGVTALPGIDSINKHAQGRCGYGPRLPLLLVSPWARHNFVDHIITDQTSITRFIEDNWLGGQRIGQGSFDGLANSINQMFDFKQVPQNDKFILNQNTGESVFSSSSG